MRNRKKLSGPLVSAVITTYNRLNLLRKTIDSVFLQTYSNIEIIVINDASTDDTEKYLQNIDSKILVYHIGKEESSGGNYARNKGIELATGEWVAFLDDDDIWYPSKIEKQIEIALQNPDIGLIYCGLRKKYILQQKIYFENIFPNQAFQGDVSKKIFESVMCLTSTLIVKKELLDSVGGFDEKTKFWQEYELTMRLCQITQVKFVNECLIEYLVDYSDEKRLSNKKNGFIQNAHYIKEKHLGLYNALTNEQLNKYQILLLNEMLSRSGKCSKKETRKYYWQIFKITKKKNDLIKYLLGYSSLEIFLCKQKIKELCRIKTIGE